MRLLIATLLTIMAVSTAHAATQQQCEALSKPVETKMTALSQIDERTPTPYTCSRVNDLIKMYVDYQAQADKLNCPFAYESGQRVGGAAERASLVNDMKKAYAEKCRQATLAAGDKP
ncbi:hypothetical protein [Noviherbaspirillum massiliense]|uniref:hypothetical protein n=1 Tax=Noviherbaspirillum massiliense TaxID=1465823 RepID=UPI0002D5D536|nr:hypothetical protein [Noviherbaspirillum massiliense]